MDALDVVVIALMVLASAGGYRVGLTARASSWLGMVVGLLLASRSLPAIIDRNEQADPRSLLLLLIFVLVLGAFLGQAVGLLIGLRLRLAIPKGKAERLDRVGGAATGTIGVLIAFWLLLPIMIRTPEWPAQQARNSTIAAWLHDYLPAAPDSGRALQRLLGPQVVEGLGAAPDLGAPPIESGLTEVLAEEVAASTVKIEAAACSRIQEGSGAVLGPDLVVTNAHVVAGARQVEVERFPDGALVEAQVVAFDPTRDAAVLYVPDLGRPPLPMDDGSFGVDGTGAVFGHPGGGDLHLSTFKVGDEVDARGRDIYDSQSTQRRVFFLAADLHPGDSGGALVDPTGRVVGVAFAIAPDRPNVAYALAIEEIHAVLGTVSPSPVETGPCLP